MTSGSVTGTGGGDMASPGTLTRMMTPASVTPEAARMKGPGTIVRRSEAQRVVRDGLAERVRRDRAVG